MKDKLKGIVSFLIELLVCFIIVKILVAFVAQPIRVSGSSMYPTYLDHSYGFVNCFNMNEDKLERFDTVVVKFQDEFIIKRLVGLPGDHISMHNDVLTINGEVVEETYLVKDYIQQQIEDRGLASFTTDFDITLGQDEYFVLGDNRVVSYDSRAMGVFNYDDFVGSGVIIIYPFDHFGVYE